MLKNVAIGIFVLVLTSCDIFPTVTPTDPNQSFSLSKLQTTIPDKIYSKLSGSDSKGVRYTGSISVANRAQTTLDGVLVTQRDFIINLQGGGTYTTITGTGYVDTNGNLLSVFIQTTGLTCKPVSPDVMPETVKIGDFGILPAMICSDNTTQERNWRVEDARNGKINFISNGTVKNQSNTIVTVTDVIFTIDGSGNIVACKIISAQPASRYKITLEVHISDTIKT